mmetsp:Transcript_76781/g.205093  ORF Transcript_76781/g.205093 Transcript_76781/m.205093 type:complete len:102 (-) Transcript_76781:977-1282(-)
MLFRGLGDTPPRGNEAGADRRVDTGVDFREMEPSSEWRPLRFGVSASCLSAVALSAAGALAGGDAATAQEPAPLVSDPWPNVGDSFRRRRQGDGSVGSDWR